MKVSGIVSEYNPFHHGHHYHIQQTKALTNCDMLINVMSGHFVQRGEPAIASKWSRAKAAIDAGCDLVIELPYAYAVQSADGFAYGAITSLALAKVDHIVFGSETNDIKELQRLSNMEYEKDMQASLAKSFDVKSNDMLGISYLKALKDYDIIPHTIQRTNDYHGLEIQGNIASATAIRTLFQQHQDVSSYTPIQEAMDAQLVLESYYPYIQTLCMTLPSAYLSTLFLMDEGIENLFKSNAAKASTFQEFMSMSISKRYTRSRIQRTLIHLLTQTTKQEVDSLPPLSHIRILAMNEKGRMYLKHLKQEEVMIASRFNQIPEAYRTMDIRAVNAYSIPFSLPKRKLIVKEELRAPLLVNI